jgi:hypothetical protein
VLTLELNLKLRRTPKYVMIQTLNMRPPAVHAQEAWHVECGERRVNGVEELAVSLMIE